MVPFLLSLLLVNCCSASESCLTLQPHELHHARLPCPSLSPGVCSNSGPLSRRGHPPISSSVVHFLSFPQSFPASEQMLPPFSSCIDARLLLPAVIVSEHFFVESQDIYHHLVLRTLSQIIWIILYYRSWIIKEFLIELWKRNLQVQMLSLENFTKCYKRIHTNSTLSLSESEKGRNNSQFISWGKYPLIPKWDRSWKDAKNALTKFQQIKLSDT